MNEKRRLALDTMIYLPAKVIEGFVSIFTLSYLTSLYSTDVYGRFSAINVTVGFVTIVVFSWLTNSCARYASEYLLDGDGEKKRDYFSSMGVTWIALTAGSITICSLAALVMSQPIYVLVGFMLSGFASFQLFTTILVQTGRKLHYAVISILMAASKLGLSVLFGTLKTFGLTTPAGAIIAYAATDIFFTLIAAFIVGFFRNFSFKGAKKSLMKHYFSYGFPLIGVGFSTALLNQAYRYIIAFFAGYGVYAVFAANSSIASSVFNMLMVGIMRAVYPSILRSYHSGGAAEAEKTLANGARLYLLLAVPSAMGLTALAPQISALVLDPAKYSDGIPIIGFTAFGLLFLGLTEYANKAWELGKNTKPILMNSLISAAINIVMNFALIPLFGFVAAGFNLFFSYLLYFLLAFFRGRKLLPLKLPLRTVGAICASGLLCAGAAFAATLLPLGNLWKIIIGILAGMLVYGASLLVFGELRDELSAIKRVLNRKKG